MPAKARTLRAYRAPKATRKKMWVHAFYLLQPFFQFFLLLAVMLFLVRCSPLAPSTEKGSELQGPATLHPSSPQAEAAALEEAIQKSLKELSSGHLSVVSLTDAKQMARNALPADEALEESSVRSLFELRKKGVHGLQSRPHVMLLPLSELQAESLFVEGSVRIPLHDRLQSKGEALKALFENLQLSQESKELGAAALLVLPDATMRRVQGAFSDLKLPLRVSLGFPSPGSAYLEVRRLEEDPAHASDNALLLESALKEALHLGILLE